MREYDGEMLGLLMKRRKYGVIWRGLCFGKHVQIPQESKPFMDY